MKAQLTNKRIKHLLHSLGGCTEEGTILQHLVNTANDPNTVDQFLIQRGLESLAHSNGMKMQRLLDIYNSAREDMVQNGDDHINIAHQPDSYSYSYIGTDLCETPSRDDRCGALNYTLDLTN